MIAVVEDQFGNIVTTDSSTVTISLASGPGGFATGSTISVAAVNGIATFSNLVLNDCRQLHAECQRWQPDE